MLPTPKNWSVFPSVMVADKPCEMVISANERAFFFQDGEEYTVVIISVNGDEFNYYNPQTHKTLSAVAAEGVLRFTFAFVGEGEHKIVVKKNDKSLAELFVYSLYDDLYELVPLRGDFHGHSCRSDGKRDPVALAGHYREQGYDFFSLTDHNRFYPGFEVDEAYEGVKTGITRIQGEEVHSPGSDLHIVHVCGETSVAAQYCDDREKYDSEVAECMSRVPANIPERYKNRYAKAMWATEKIHEAGGVAIFPHPYWIPGSSVYNACDELSKILLKSGMFDAFELCGAMRADGNNRALALWQELRVDGYDIKVVASSDVHSIQNSFSFPNSFTVCFARENTREAIKEALLNAKTVAVEAEGVEYSRHYRTYGSLRLISYAQFLLKYYFPIRERICQGGGVAMRAYAIGEAPAELVELSCDLAERFSLRFFGRMPARIPSAEQMNFEERCRARQALGPKTAGSIVYPDYPVE